MKKIILCFVSLFFLSNVFAETKLSRNEEINLLNKIGYGVTSEDLNHLEKIEYERASIRKWFFSQIDRNN